jgi:tetratricopeptide (TPR) repeat protein
MIRNRFFLVMAAAATLMGVACARGTEPAGPAPWRLKDLVGPVQKSVVTVINYDLEGDVSSIGSGFFISKSGILLTSFHVLEGAYKAEIRTLDGSQFPVTSIVAANKLVDLIKVRIDIPDQLVTPLPLARTAPAVTDGIFVVGSPMGLEHTVSEGIVSAIRKLPAGGKVLQLTAPISPGSSGGPVLDHDGKVIGIVTFQAARGQNLNFAISVNALEGLSNKGSEPSIAEWTIRNAKQGPALAASLCSKGARLSIQGEYEEALTYFKKAAEANPEDPDAWYGLGSCYVGLDRPEDAIAAYKRPLETNPDNAMAHFILAMYYKTIGQYEQVIPNLLAVIRIDPTNVVARFELGSAYGALQRTDEQIGTFREILTAQPDHVPTLINLGTALGDSGHLDEAISLFNRARSLEPDNELVHYNMGVTYNRMNRSEAAIRAYVQAIHANPRMAAAHYNLGITYLDQGRRKLALDQYEILHGLEAAEANKLFEQIYPDRRDSPPSSNPAP